MAISGTGVALATAGGILLYAGLQGESPLVALREIIKGGPKPLSSNAASGPAAVGSVSDTASSLFNTYANAQGSAAGALVSLFSQWDMSGLVVAATHFKADKYSQVRRWQTGYSDCSSFVGKSLKALGMNPPGASVTGDYLAWNLLYKVDPANAKAGDLLVNSNHMVIAMGPDQAIGQQNPRRNVDIGTFSNLMAGTGAYLCLRFVNIQTDTLTTAQLASAKKAIPGFQGPSLAPGQVTSTTGYSY